ncbi:MAG: molybdenum cofactor biosynthesis protein MoaD [Saprospiraceae bacterium]|nr:molybdenum cofactor biosynthesis protein MoaD [Saprospiraceae bacterium]
MPTVKFTYALRRFFPNLKDTEVSAQDLPKLLHCIDGHYPGIRNYIVDERGALRKHVLIFIDGEQINDREKLGDQFTATSEIYIVQSLSGG